MACELVRLPVWYLPVSGFLSDVSSAAPMRVGLWSVLEHLSVQGSNPMLQASANSTAQILVDKSTRFQSLLDASIEDTVGTLPTDIWLLFFDGSVQKTTPQGVFCGSVPILISDASFDVTRKL